MKGEKRKSSAIDFGHDQAVTDCIEPVQLCNARIGEIRRLEASIEASRRHGGKRVFQTLPKHLRRRAASHNPRRLPLKYRSRAQQEASHIDQTRKRPRKTRRLQRRRNPKLLIKQRLNIQPRTFEQSTESLSPKWIETHYWHAKRMKMTNMWGYRLAEQNTQKIYRTMIKSLKTDRTLIYDISYEQLFIVKGNSADVKAILDHLTDKQFAVDVDEKIKRLGQSRSRVAKGECWIREPGNPQRLVCPINYLFVQNHENAYCMVFCHPSTADHVFGCFSRVVAVRHSAATIVDVTGNFNKFELVGKRSVSLFFSLFRPIHGTEDFGILRGLKNAGLLSKDWMVSGQVLDPRLGSNTTTDLQQEVEDQIRAYIRGPTIYSDELVQQVGSFVDLVMGNATIHKVPEKDINVRRQIQNLDWPEKKMLDFTENDSAIPFILMKRKTSSGSNEPVVFELLLPKHWGLEFWIKLVYANCLGLALSDRRTLFEAFYTIGQLQDATFAFPFYSPATSAFNEQVKQDLYDLMEQDSKRPKQKRLYGSSLCQIGQCLANPQGWQPSPEMIRNVQDCSLLALGMNLVSVMFLGRGRHGPFSSLHSVSGGLEKFVSQGGLEKLFDPQDSIIDQLIATLDCEKPVEMVRDYREKPPKLHPLENGKVFVDTQEMGYTIVNPSNRSSGAGFNILYGRSTSLAIAFSEPLCREFQRQQKELGQLNKRNPLLDYIANLESGSSQVFCFLRNAKSPAIYYPVIVRFDCSAK